MKKYLRCLLLTSAWAVALAAQEGERRIVIATESGVGGTTVTLCCTPVDRFKAGDLCNQVRRYSAQGERASLQVGDLCNGLKANATREWFVSVAEHPHKMLYRIDCEKELAWPLETPSPSPSVAQPTPSAPAPAPKSQDPQVSGSSDKGHQAGTEKINNRLKKLEEALSEQKKVLHSLKEELEKRGAADRELEKKLEALQSDVQDKLRTLGEAQKNSCYRIDDNYKGHEEVTIAVAGSVLRFLKVKPRVNSVPIGLAEAKARELLAEVQGQSSTTIFPHIYLAVPEAVREVHPFFLQDRLIDSTLYSRLTGGKDAGRVSYQDVSRFIEELNFRCSGSATFALPTEEQFVAAAHWIYEPVANGLKRCDNLRKEDLRSDVTELLGNSWQLTRSLCQTFSEHPKATCPDNSYVRKGGAASSNSLECMPEYRSPAPFDVNQKETSFRLALVK